jgi:hypothetical protein
MKSNKLILSEYYYWEFRPKRNKIHKLRRYTLTEFLLERNDDNIDKLIEESREGVQSKVANQ